MADQTDQILASRIPVSEPSAFGELGRIAAGEASRRGVGQALSAAEFDAGIKLAQRMADLEEYRKVLDHPEMLKYPQMRQRIANTTFYIEEASQALDSIMAVANENERALLKSASRGVSSGAKALTVAPAMSPKRAAAIGLRGASKLAGPAVALYEGARAARNIYDYGLVPGVVETGGNIVGELGGVVDFAGRGLQQTQRLDPTGMNPTANTFRALGDVLSGAGSVIGKASSARQFLFGPADDDEIDPATKEFLRTYGGSYSRGRNK
jgi:hypothetical protein